MESHIPFTYPNSDAEEDFYNEAEDLQVDGVDIIRSCLCLACGGGNGVTRM
jgi:hypothetical protein